MVSLWIHNILCINTLAWEHYKIPENVHIAIWAKNPIHHLRVSYRTRTHSIKDNPILKVIMAFKNFWESKVRGQLRISRNLRL